jgi:spermidine/putrescine-binding protein
MGRRLRAILVALPLLALAGLTACDDGKPPVAKPQLAKELVFYSWAEYMPQAVLDEFATEYGVKVVYELYDSTEAAVANIRVL